MGFKKVTDYSINKRTEDIVYSYANGEIDRYVKEKNADGEPTGRIILIHISESGNETRRVLSKSEMTLEQFDRIKSFSDEEYRDEERADVCEWRNTVSQSGFEECGNGIFADSGEDEFITGYGSEPVTDVRTIENAMKIIDACLTEKQKKRYIAYFAGKKSQERIAREEGVIQRTVGDSIELAKKKISLFLKNHPEYTSEKA